MLTKIFHQVRPLVVRSCMFCITFVCVAIGHIYDVALSRNDEAIGGRGQGGSRKRQVVHCAEGERWAQAV